MPVLPAEGLDECRGVSFAPAEELGLRGDRAGLDGVDETSFYRLRELGHEEYSIMSVVENQVNHDREHAEQVQTILNQS